MYVDIDLGSNTLTISIVFRMEWTRYVNVGDKFT